MKTEPDFRIIHHEDGWQECAACGMKSKGSPGQVALGQMGMVHNSDCPNYPLILKSVYSLLGRS